MQLRWIVVGALCLAFAACQAGQDEVGPEGGVDVVSLGKADTASGAGPVLSFNADWTVTQSAPLVAGSPYTLHYDIARLPACRTQYRGFAAWDIAANIKVDGGPLATPSVTTGTTVRTGVDVGLIAPVGHDLEMWFTSSDEGGCQQYDSNYGRNFHFAVTSAVPTVHLRANWTMSVDGSPRGGADLMVDYDLARLAACRGSSNGYQAWDVSAHYRWDGGAEQIASVTQVVGMYGRGQAPARLHAPAGARDLELWFENTDVYGCHAWDSDYGRNFHVALR